MPTHAYLFSASRNPALRYMNRVTLEQNLLSMKRGVTVMEFVAGVRVQQNGDQRADVRPQHAEVDGEPESVGASAFVPTPAFALVGSIALAHGSVALVGAPTTEVRRVLERHYQQ